MLCKVNNNKLASIQPTPELSSLDASLLSQELAPLVRTPRCLTFKKEDTSIPS